MTRTLKDMLQSIETSGDYTSAITALSNIKQVLAKRSESVEGDEDTSTAYSEESLLSPDDLSTILNVAERYGTIIHNYEKYLDAKLLNPILESIGATITDNGSAIQAIYFYDVNWFKTTPISAKAKSEVAAKLIAECNKYANYTLGIWRQLAAMNMASLISVSYDYRGESND